MRSRPLRPPWTASPGPAGGRPFGGQPADARRDIKVTFGFAERLLSANRDFVTDLVAVATAPATPPAGPARESSQEVIRPHLGWAGGARAVSRAEAGGPGRGGRSWTGAGGRMADGSRASQSASH